MEFGVISRTKKNPSCSKPCAVPRHFAKKRSISKPCEFTSKRHTVAEGGIKPLTSIYEALHRDVSDFEELPKFVMFKTMGYSQGFLIQNGQFSTLANSAEIDTNSRARS